MGAVVSGGVSLFISILAYKTSVNSLSVDTLSRDDSLKSQIIDVPSGYIDKLTPELLQNDTNRAYEYLVTYNQTIKLLTHDTNMASFSSCYLWGHLSAEYWTELKTMAKLSASIANASSDEEKYILEKRKIKVATRFQGAIKHFNDEKA